MTSASAARLAFALEYSLGHISHAENLKQAMQALGRAGAHYLDLPYDDPSWRWSRLPGVRSNWSLRASLRAYLGLRPLARRVDGILFHTQVTSLLSAGLMRRIPSVISLDATPLQYDALGSAYGHTPGNERVEALKKRLNQRAFAAARALVTWSQWAKDSLAADYGVAPEKVTVIPPGIDTERWSFPPRPARPDGTVNLLFVGGDFFRKGGDLLIEALCLLPPSTRAHLHVVTRSRPEGPLPPNVTVHCGLKPNTAELRSLFREADLFTFPSRGDCLPLAVMEALTAGLPVITTSVGALSEAVRHGETGLVVPMDDAAALAGAIQRLVENTGERRQMSENAREVGRTRFNAQINYPRLLQVVEAAIPAH